MAVALGFFLVLGVVLLVAALGLAIGGGFTRRAGAVLTCGVVFVVLAVSGAALYDHLRYTSCVDRYPPMSNQYMLPGGPDPKYWPEMRRTRAKQVDHHCSEGQIFALH